MRTNYPLDKIVRRKDDERRRLAFALMVIGLVTFLLIFNNSVRVGLNKVVIMVTRPFWIIENNTLVLGGDLFKFLRSHKGLVEENRHLKEEIFKLKIDLATKKLLQADYEKLAAVVGRSEGGVVPVLGRVILKPSRTPYDLVVVDVGTSSARSVKVGDVVRLSPEVTIGKVVNISGKTSTVELFSSPGLKTDVFVGEDRVSALALGRGGGNMLIELPRGVVVESGDSVILSDGSDSLIGFVGEVINDQTEPAQEILVSLPVNLSNLSWVEIYEQ